MVIIFSPLETEFEIPCHSEYSVMRSTFYVLFNFQLHHEQDCQAYPVVCEKCSKDGIPRAKVKCTFSSSLFAQINFFLYVDETSPSLLFLNCFFRFSYCIINIHLWETVMVSRDHVHFHRLAALRLRYRKKNVLKNIELAIKHSLEC